MNLNLLYLLQTRNGNNYLAPSNNFMINLIFFICIVQTGSTRHVGHLLAYCTCPAWLWGWRIWWNEWQGKPKYWEKTCPGATLSTTNPTWPDPGLNPGRRGGKPAPNRFSYGAAITLMIHNQYLCSTVHNSTEGNVSSYEAATEWIKDACEFAHVIAVA
jgi:hypothetical protein